MGRGSLTVASKMGVFDKETIQERWYLVPFELVKGLRESILGLEVLYGG